MYCTVMYCTVLYCTVLYFDKSQDTHSQRDKARPKKVLYCTVLWSCSVPPPTVSHEIFLCSTTVLYSTVLYFGLSCGQSDCDTTHVQVLFSDILGQSKTKKHYCTVLWSCLVPPLTVSHGIFLCSTTVMYSTVLYFGLACGQSDCDTTHAQILFSDILVLVCWLTLDNILKLYFIYILF
jgi:hypothetical protein